jgi:hypothetical protein
MSYSRGGRGERAAAVLSRYATSSKLRARGSGRTRFGYRFSEVSTRVAEVNLSTNGSWRRLVVLTRSLAAALSCILLPAASFSAGEQFELNCIVKWKGGMVDDRWVVPEPTKLRFNSALTKPGFSRLALA